MIFLFSLPVTEIFSVPQFILDSLIMSNHGSTASIVVTQPRSVHRGIYPHRISRFLLRRLSAISVAARVSSERIEDGSVGYAIRGESKQGKNTKLLFCTTGVVLRRLGSGDTLENVSHVVVDEVRANPPLPKTARLKFSGPRAIRRRRFPLARAQRALETTPNAEGRPHVCDD